MSSSGDGAVAVTTHAPTRKQTERIENADVLSAPTPGGRPRSMLAPPTARHRRDPLGIPVAAGVLYPLLGLLRSPMIASAAMSLSSVSVIANAFRLRKVTL
jgi:hypothetical protein